MYNTTELQEGFQRACECVYTSHCLGGKPNEMRAIVGINQDNDHLRLLTKIFLSF